ncbi:AbfB domain-containing protein [Actinoplanes sp. NEAU-A12]|uniref:AbfB domain-containing protein n=1 Tax=Actinoplanes sandaracinus TaxID=3045177 RepID=A0ABT6WTG6_9ACTN|nr:AbfB domain-containing protein [Actinoplanes sandaracinus]MDI6103036.1 AbfB domain-containing protein [Actinoplanes sandaracinus]
MLTTAFRRHLMAEVVIGAVLIAACTALLPGPAAGAPPGPAAVGATPVVLNQPADPFLGKITPSANADTQGMYAPQVATPLVAIHAVLLPNGHVVSYGSPVGEARQGGLAYDDWNPALGTGTASHRQVASMHAYDSFCNALEILPDGRVLMVGGNTTTASMVYDPATGNQAMGAPLARQRWYASVVRLPDDRMLVLGGGDYYNTNAFRNPNDNSGVATVPEIGTGTGAWTSLTGAASTVAFGAKDNRWWYPRATIAPDGKVFGVSNDQMWRLDPAGTGAVRSLGTLPQGIGVSGSSVMYAPGKMLYAGGGQRFNETAEVATNAATTVDINGANPVVTRVAPMRYARNWLNLTVLANGEVLANGGTRVGTQAGAANSITRSEIWNPATRQWRSAASAQRTRTYHSVALQLPGGSVLTSGGGLPGPVDNFNSEIYYPAYLFTRSGSTVRWADRPEIRTMGGSAAYGGTLSLGMSDTRRIASASLTSLGRVTHSYNTDQRQVPLTISQSGATVRVTLPTNRNVLPPGSYLLQGVDHNGVPTPAQIITLKGDGTAGTVTVYEPEQGQAGTPGGSAEPGTVPLTAGTTVGLEAASHPGYRVRHQDFIGKLSAVGPRSSMLARADSSFRVRAGLAGTGCVSFEAANYPGYFLRHENSRAYLRRNDNSAAFAAAATFCPRTGLTGQHTSLESYNMPGRYLRHRNFAIHLDAFDNSAQARKDATFVVRVALGG